MGGTDQTMKISMGCWHGGDREHPDRLGLCSAVDAEQRRLGRISNFALQEDQTGRCRRHDTVPFH